MSGTAATKEYEEDLDPCIPIDSLICMNMETKIRNAILPDILSVKM